MNGKGEVVLSARTQRDLQQRTKTAEYLKVSESRECSGELQVVFDFVGEFFVELDSGGEFRVEHGLVGEFKR